MLEDGLLQEHLDSAIEAAQKTNPELARTLATIAGCNGLNAPLKEKELLEYYQTGIEIGQQQNSIDPVNNAITTEIASSKITNKRSQQQLKAAQGIKKKSQIALIGAFILSLIGISGIIYGNRMNAIANAEINKAQEQQAKLLELTNENNRFKNIISSLEEESENLQQDLEVLQESELAKEVEKWRKDYQELNQKFVNTNQKLNKACSRKRVRFFASECKGRR